MLYWETLFFRKNLKPGQCLFQVLLRPVSYSSWIFKESFLIDLVPPLQVSPEASLIIGSSGSLPTQKKNSSSLEVAQLGRGERRLEFYIQSTNVCTWKYLALHRCLKLFNFFKSCSSEPPQRSISAFQPPELWEKNCLLCKPCSLWYSVTTGRVD